MLSSIVNRVSLFQRHRHMMPFFDRGCFFFVVLIVRTRGFCVRPLHSRRFDPNTDLRYTSNTKTFSKLQFHQGSRLYAVHEHPLNENLLHDTVERIVVGSDAVLSQNPLPTDATQLQMLSFYHFEPISDILEARNGCYEAIRHIPGLRGTIYFAEEGMNAQMAVPLGEPLNTLLEACSTKLVINPFQDQPPNLGDVVPIDVPTFDRLIVRTRDYVLRDGMNIEHTGLLDWADAGNELTPAEWHQSLQGNDKSSMVILDCRNSYESEKGTFQGAIPLETQNFQQSWEALREATKDLTSDTPIAIFCTGGIRCVKTGAFLKQTLGFENVSRLQHGIIGYQRFLQEAELPQEESLWNGENFLFDKRRQEREG